jgi:hypothetical protein
MPGASEAALKTEPENVKALSLDGSGRTRNLGRDTFQSDFNRSHPMRIEPRYRTADQ